MREFRPVRVRFNAQGLREGRPIPTEKGKHEFRILVLGDSFVEARQVPYDMTMKGLEPGGYTIGKHYAFDKKHSCAVLVRLWNYMSCGNRRGLSGR